MPRDVIPFVEHIEQRVGFLSNSFEASNLSLGEWTIDGFEFPTIYFHFRVFVEENSIINILVHLAVLAVFVWSKNLK